MIVVGLSGGIGQGKSTVGHLLRKHAGSSIKCDLEFSYPISEAVSKWLALWPKKFDIGKDPVELANWLIELLPPILTEATGKPVKLDQLELERTEASLASHDKLLRYLKAWRNAGDLLHERFPLPITPDNKYLHREILQWVGATTVEKVDGRIWSDVVGRRIDTLEGRGEPLVTIGGTRSPGDVAMIHEHRGYVVRVVRPGAKPNADATETWSAEWRPDLEVINNGTMDELSVVVEQLWHDLANGHVKNSYKAV